VTIKKFETEIQRRKQWSIRRGDVPEEYPKREAAIQKWKSWEKALFDVIKKN
jgi:hypothetical protein